MRILVSIGTVLIALQSYSQQANEAIQAGNQSYRLGKFEIAEKDYSDAVKFQPENITARYNLANTIHRRGRDEEAIKAYDAIAKDEKEAEMKSKAYYNKGAILSKQKKLEQSIEAYKNALRQNPNDKEARENLQKALVELKSKQPPPEKKEDQKKKKQDQQQKQKEQQRPKMNQKEAEQRLKLLEQKEKEVQQRLQKEKSKSGGGGQRDW